ncbi:MAG: type II toxin-antitoxin system HipA family toxin [Campylobacterota bacterium]|nr:type II toxin-antitoxin system HipA family toxin [Campylobacterota bacterium]
MNTKDLKVFINREVSGSLSKEDDTFVFNYSEGSAEAVSLTMPLRKASWNSKTIHPIFEMNLPEGALKDAIKNRFAKIKQMDELGFLELIGSYMLGRIKFNTIVEDKDSLVLDDILHGGSDRLFSELLDKFAIRSGVSGVQPKLLLSAHNKTSMKFEHYIVKSWEKEYPQLALNEYFCMRAISNAGLVTPEFYLSDDLSMFVMKRFDILDENRYMGFEDMCVLTARATDDKYRGSYEEVTRVIKETIPAKNRRASLKIFFKALVMNHLLKNGDGHLKNYGILYKDGYEDANIAPIYDVITTTVYIKNDIPALKMSDAKLWWRLKTYRVFAKQSCGLSNKEIETVLQECRESIVKTKFEIDTYKTSKQEIREFLEELKGCWREEI